jgi:hypothetical protein
MYQDSPRNQSAVIIPTLLLALLPRRETPLLAEHSEPAQSLKEYNDLVYNHRGTIQ